MRFPRTCDQRVVQAKNKADQEKFGAALGKMVRADPSLHMETDRDTLQTLLRGMGELHLEVTLDRMRTEFNVEGVMGEPQVAYRETITKRVDEQYVHKKQTGGSGQFAEVWITSSPRSAPRASSLWTRPAAARCHANTCRGREGPAAADGTGRARQVPEVDSRPPHGRQATTTWTPTP